MTDQADPTLSDDTIEEERLLDLEERDPSACEVDEEDTDDDDDIIDASEAPLGHQLGARTGLGRSAHRILCSYTGPPGKHQRGARTKLGRSAHRSSHGETQCI